MSTRLRTERTRRPTRHSGPQSPPLSTRSAWLHLAVLWTFAVAQPLFELFAESPEFLIARGNAWPDILVVSLALVLLPPTLMVGAELAVSRRHDVRRYVHLGFLALLTATLALQMFKELVDPSNKLLPLFALAAGVALAAAYERGPLVPTVLTVLSPAPLVVLVWFLAISPVSGLAFPKGSDVKAGRLSNPVPVVLTIFDELSLASLIRDGRIDGERYPAFATLADGATWYPNATTVADNTTRAVPAILTGHLADDDALPVESDHPGSIFDRLAGNYRLHVYEPVTHLCPTDLCPRSREEWPERSRALVRSIGSIMKSRLAPGDSADFLGLPSETLESRPEEMRDYVSELQPGRTLNVLHVELPHTPYQYAPDGRRYTRAVTLPGLTGEHWGPDAKLVADGRRHYLLQLRFTDRLLGELLAKLRASGLYDEALLVVTADHGVSFQRNASRRDVTEANVGEIGGVPLFVKAPGQERRRIDPTPARTIDILPTIGDYLDVDWNLPGRSVRTPWSSEMVVVSAQFGPRVKVPLAEFVRLRNRAAKELEIAAAELD
jgi:hypothetical protein